MSAVVTEEEGSPQAALDLDRSDWELVSFGDVALKQNASIDRENTNLTRYVAGEHMGSEDLHLHKWGEIGEDYLGPAFTRKFEEGDILYGSRRTYLRKVAVAHFDGITANTTFVIKPNEELILKELLPFVMLSEGFAQHSIRNSKGSVNPYVNWKDIASYEFLLPPKDQQPELAELLWTADSVVENLKAGLNKAEVTIAAKLKVLFGKSKSKRNESFDLRPFSECVHLQPGVAKGKKPKNGESFVSLPYLRVANVQDGHLNLDEIKEISLPEKDVPKYLLQDEDVVICEGGDFDKVGRGAIWEGSVSPCLHQNHVFCLRCDQDQILPRFLELQLQSNYGKGYFLGCAKKTSNLASINSTQVKQFPLQVTSLERQRSIVEEFRVHRSASAAFESQLQVSKRLLKSLINQVF